MYMNDTASLAGSDPTIPHEHPTQILWLPTSDGGYALHEAVVVQDDTDGSYREVHRPVQDERIAFLLRVDPELARRIDPRYVW